MSLSLPEDLYWLPTPEGAYYAVASSEETPQRRFLCRLLSQTETPRLTNESLPVWSEGSTPKEFLTLLNQLRARQWVQGLSSRMTVIDRPLEDIMPGLLTGLSDGGHALLADSQGFYIASSGFPHQTAEELAALSADLMTLHQRHQALLAEQLRIGQQSWGLIDAGGHSRLGIWPLHIGRHCFALVLSGIPHFNHPNFVQLVWFLMNRYSPASLPL